MKNKEGNQKDEDTGDIYDFESHDEERMHSAASCAGGNGLLPDKGAVQTARDTPRQDSSAQAGGLSLEEGIAQIARDIEAGLPEGTSVAAVNFE